MTNSILLHVRDTGESAAFYTRLLGQQPADISPTFAFFILPSGLGLGLWTRDGIVPASGAGTGMSEIGFKADSPADVDRMHAEWRDRGATILLAPQDLDFGRSFVAADPDGHRLRVYTVSDS